MFVKMGPYKDWIGPYQLSDLLQYVGVSEERCDKIGEWLSNTWINTVCEKLHRKRNRNIKIRIDRYDTWSMDHTLAHIILPMLKQLKATKHGSPYVDQSDLPVELRLTKREQKVFDEGHWNKNLKATEEEIDAASKKFHSQFDWVMDQMIWSFEQELNEDEGRQFYYDPYSPDEEIEDDPDDNIINEDGTTTKSASLFTKEWKRKMGKFNMEKHKEYQTRKQLGFTLFGKYYQSLWD